MGRGRGKGRGRGGRGRGRGYHQYNNNQQYHNQQQQHRSSSQHSNNRSVAHPVGTPPSAHPDKNEQQTQPQPQQPSTANKQPPGPRMPDGTRGFTMGRGKPQPSVPSVSASEPEPWIWITQIGRREAWIVVCHVDGYGGDLPFRSLSVEVGFLIGPYNAFACAVCTSKTCGALVCD